VGQRQAVLQRDRDFYMNGWFDAGSDAPGFPQWPASRPHERFRPTQAAVDALFAAPGIVPGGTGPGSVKQRQRNLLQSRWHAVRDRRGEGLQRSHRDRRHPFQVGLGDGFSGMRLQPNGNLGQVFYDGYASTPQERRTVFAARITTSPTTCRRSRRRPTPHNEVETRGGYRPRSPCGRRRSRTTAPARFRRAANAARLALHAGSRRAGPLLPGAPGSAASQPWCCSACSTPPRPGAAEERGRRLSGHGRRPGQPAEPRLDVGSLRVDGSNRRHDINDNLPSLQRYQSLVAQPNFGVGTFVAATKLRPELAPPVCRSSGPRIHRRTVSTRSTCTAARSPTSRRTSSKRTCRADRGHEIGRLRFAAGVSNRKNSFSYTPFYDDASIIENPIGLFASNTTAGSTEVSELYGELLLP